MPSKYAALLFLLLAGFCGHTEAQVYRCTVDGKQIYQQSPCATNAASGEKVRIQVDPSRDTPARPKASAAPERATEKTAVQHAGSPPVGVTPNPPPAIEPLAEACLNWYRPMLRDPRGAYVRDTRLEKNVLRMTIYATNGFGGYVNKAAACEIKAGAVEESWTRLHAQDLAWGK